MTFGEHMRALMRDRGMSLRALANAVPCDVGHLSKVSSDHKPASERVAERLDELLGACGSLKEL